MACRYTYKGKTYEAHEFDDVLRAMPPAEAAKYMPGVEPIPNAPFVGNTQAWLSLALKRIIKYAADEGFDRVAWTNGEQQADRYDLSKQVRTISWSGTRDGTKVVSIEPINGNDIEFRVLPDGKTASISGGPSGNEFTEKRLDEVVGKEVSEKILAERDGVLSGSGLKVGGEGMRAFYDKIVPNVANDVLKKLGGGRVGTISVGEGKPRLSAFTGEPQGYDSYLDQPGFDITPELRARAAQGLPMFSIGLGDLTPEQEKAVKNVIGKPPTLKERAEQFRAHWKKELAQGLFDQFAPLKELSQHAYMLARMSKGGDSTLESAFLYGKISVDKQGFYRSEYTDQARTEGFAGKMAKLKGEHDRFLLWMAAKRAALLTAEQRENLFKGADIKSLLTLAQGKMKDGTDRFPLYQQAEKDLTEFNNSFLKIGRDSKLLSEDSYNYLKDRPYIPFYRMVEDGAVNGFGQITPGLANQYFAKKLKGGKGKLHEDLLANVLQNWSHVITASSRNRALLVTMKAAVKAGVAERVSSDYKGKDKVSVMGEVIRKIPEGQTYEENGKTLVSDGKKEVVVHGEITYRITDPHIFDAVTSLEYAGLGAWSKPFVAAKRYLTMGVTVNPTFKFRNLVRDSVAAPAVSDLSYNPWSNIKLGWGATAQDSPVRAQMLAAGGMIRFGSMLDGNNSSRAQRLIDKGVDQDMILDSRNKIEKFWKHRVMPAIEAYQEFGDRGEQVNRAALYQRLLDKGMSHGEAAFWARDLMDFSMSGKWAAIRTLTQLVPFMNARLQGLYKLGRAANEDWRRMGTVLLAVSLASVGLMLAQKDDDEFKKLPDWVRDNFWNIRIGDYMAHLPKPFELGAMGSFAERLFEWWASDEMNGDRFARVMRDIVFNQLSMNPWPQLVKPLIDIYANKDSFRGTPIESFAMERLQPQDRYTPRTSQAARFIGSLGLPNPMELAMGRYSSLSPVQVDFMVRAYFGWLGTGIMTSIDYGIRPMVEQGARPAMNLKDVFLVGNFIESLPAGSSRYVEELYRDAKSIEEAYGSYKDKLKQGDKEAAKRVLADNPEIKRQPIVEALKVRLGDVRRREQMVERDKDMTAGAKREELNKLAQMKDRIARKALPAPQ